MDEYIVEKVNNLVTKWHGGQSYGEHPYTFHLNMVASRCEEMYGEDVVTWVVAMLHDVIEDAQDETLAISDVAAMVLDFCQRGKISYEESKIICKSVGYLTKGKSTTRNEYLSWLTTDEVAVKVKLADALCNLECSIISEDKRRINRYLDTIKKISEVL